MQHEVMEAAAHIRSRLSHRPDIALILGSGLGDLADDVTDAVSFETADIPHFPASTVHGHRGRLVFGVLGSSRVVVVQGRLHMYEGYPLGKVLFPVSLVSALGASSLVVTNASGGIRPGFRPGTLMWITDHINWTGTSLPLPPQSPEGKSPETGVRHAKRTAGYYDLSWTARAMRASEDLGIPTERGTYLWTRGPSYETKAEIRSFRVLGADAVGMSTVPEVVAAHHAGMAVIGLSTITNLAAGLGDGALNHAEVIETGQSVKSSLRKLILAVLDTAPDHQPDDLQR